MTSSPSPIQTLASKYETHVFGQFGIIAWRRPVDDTARFTVWTEESILPNVTWPDAWAFIINRHQGGILAVEDALRTALALNEGR